MLIKITGFSMVFEKPYIFNRLDFHSSSFSCRALVANPLRLGLYTLTHAKYNPTHMLLNDINFYTCDEDAIKVSIKLISAEVESLKPEKSLLSPL